MSDDSVDTLKNRFRGNKPITLKKDEYWLIVPKGEDSGVSTIKYQEDISKALGIEKDNSESSRKKQEPEVMKPDLVLSTLAKLNMSEERYNDVVSIVSKLAFDPLFKVISAKEIFEVFKSKTSSEQEIEDKIYTLNVMLEVLGKSLDPERVTQINNHWHKTDKQKAQAFYFAFSAISGSLSSDMEKLDKFFSSPEKAKVFMNRVKIGLELVKRHADLICPPPTAPQRQDMYEEISDNGANTNSTENNDGNTVDNVLDSNGQPSPQVQTSTTNGTDSSSTPITENTVEKG